MAEMVLTEYPRSWETHLHPPTTSLGSDIFGRMKGQGHPLYAEVEFLPKDMRCQSSFKGDHPGLTGNFLVHLGAFQQLPELKAWDCLELLREEERVQGT